MIAGAGGRRFYRTGMEHSPTSATGSAWERTPWPATQRAASEALNRNVLSESILADTIPPRSLEHPEQSKATN